MLKSIHKKKLSLLFTIMALAIPCTLCPMKKRCTESVIKSLPDDCLCEIFQFYADEDIKNSLDLRLVCKDFKKVIDTYPCYLVRINKKPYFLRYPLKYHFIFTLGIPCFIARLHDEEAVKKLVNESWPSALKNGSFHVYMKLHEKKYTNFLLSHLKDLMPRLKKNENRLGHLKIQFHDASGYIELSDIDIFKKIQTDRLLFSNKKVVSNEELNMFGTVQNLVLENCNRFAGKKIKWPEGLQELSLGKCNNFGLGCLKNLVGLKKLKLDGLHELEGKKLYDIGLKNLESLTVLRCEKLNSTGLEELETLRNLTIDEYGLLEAFCPETLKNIDKLKMERSFYYDRAFEDDAFDEKIYKVLKTARELKKLRKLKVPRSLYFSENQKISDELEKFENDDSCSIKFYTSAISIN